ncbi:hypothetical protein NDU88_000128 [Pleurodeles waltl]|uniref:Uncharacterized protein n=1 Tax=Pleurodeles waltl TaxID=8319 RepID=A0AAV7TE82_PLEWA|nr:hypothetical protein NDU88_000128 [Pleurodeles waltl]
MVFGGLTLVLSLFPRLIAIPPISGTSIARVLRLRAATPFLAVDGPRLLMQVLIMAANPQPRRVVGPQWASPSPGAWRLSVPPCPGAYSALDFQTTRLRTHTRYVHAAAPRLLLCVAAGVAAPPLHQFEVSCCRDRVSGSENFVISTMWGLVPHTSAILVFWSSRARSYFLLSYLIGGVATAPGSARGSADVGIPFD